MCCQVHNRNLITVLTFALKRGERGRSPCLATVPRCSSALLRFLSPSTDGYYYCLAEILKQNETHKSLLISPLIEWAIETFQGLLPSDAPLCVCFVFLTTRYDLILYFSVCADSPRCVSRRRESQQLAVIRHCFISHFRLPFFFFLFSFHNDNLFFH